MRATRTLLKKAALQNPSPRYAPALEGGRASAATLRSLVSLHHQSATFMRAPEEVPTVFEQTFRYQRPEYEPYGKYLNRALGELAARGAGAEAMAERAANGVGARRTTPLEPARLSRNLFRDPNPYGRESPLSERELQVKETLFGTWERDGATARGTVRPSLEGVIEIAERRGGVRKVAKEWKGQEEDSTEDGM